MTTIRKALEVSFNAFDNDLSANALNEKHSDLSKQYAEMAMAGSCATVAHIRGANLHVANIGDSAAVLGLCNRGAISAIPLSKSHCVDNADEVQRIRDAHPLSETNNVIVGGRLLENYFLSEHLVMLDTNGQLSYKRNSWWRVLYHKLTPDNHFMVLATDGLWDCLDPDTVVRLVSDHTLGMQTLTPYKPFAGTPLAQNRKKPLDENSATHLLRHALGGPGEVSAQYLRLIEMLQLPPDVTRRYRDDITIIVIHFDQNYLHNPVMPECLKTQSRTS
ncbi:[Pyruvate dehydrogenase [acetyl-transferring]]-phosphatase 1, mitochondrial [Dirofilaria immitis]|nr:[Pyruvate dehydrogenase [acetyl-transferring]]-phosphatase 1, mitochondrial [Dirofilaria immitis]